MNNKNKKNKADKKLIILICILGALIVALVTTMLVSGIGDLKGNDKNTFTTSETADDGSEEEMSADGQKSSKPVDVATLEKTIVKAEMEDGQTFTMEVYPEIAPKTVENFLNLVNDGFYDGLIFHRVIAGFMAQGGDPEGTGFGGSDKQIVGEFSSNGFENNLSHERGVVSMARSGDPNSASSQFFICYDDASFLDGDYAAFGRVIEGMETVDSFLLSGTDEDDRPLKEVKIKTMKVVG